MNNDLNKFYELCEFYILRNIELSTGIPTNTKLQNNYRYLLIYLELKNDNNPIERATVKEYLKTCAYSDDFIAEVVRRSVVNDRMLELLDYFESYLVDEIEKCLYGHGDKCYTSLYNFLDLVLRIKQEKYQYGYKNVNDLLVRGYYFKCEDAEKFDKLAAFHTPEECPD